MIRALWRRRALSALLAAGVAAAGPSGVGRAADEPDLKLEEVHLFMNAGGQVNDRVISFKVTNVGNRDAPEGQGGFQVLGPTPAPEEPLKIPTLARNGGSKVLFAQLPAPCDGHVVRLWVQAPGETDFADNTVNDLKLCPNQPPLVPATQSGGISPVAPTELEGGPSGAKQAINSAGIISPVAPTELEAGPATGRQVIDAVAHLLPGKHELEFEPSVRRSLSRNTYRDPFTRALTWDSSHPDELFVGWNGSGRYDFRVSQTAVNFDLAKLHEVEKPSIEEAHLSFIEHPIDWGGDVRERPDLPGCVAELGIATNDWTVPPRQFISSELLFRDRHLTFKFLPHTLTTGELSSGQRWRAFVVTDHVQNQMLPDDTASRFGYVLHSAVEDDRHPPSGGVCMSRIAAIRLWVTYVVEST